MTSISPREAAVSAEIGTSLPSGDDERAVGYGVLGLPFTSGHYLAFRDFHQTTFGPPYRAVWHRDPSGAWTIYSTVRADQSCPRYLSSALSRPTVVAPIDVTWLDDFTVRVYIDDVLDWTMTARPTLATRLITSMGSHLPAKAWTSPALLTAMGRMSRPVLAAGRMRLSGVLPNGQEFTGAPQRVWEIIDSVATVNGDDLGPVGPLPQQAHLGDFWLPQRGIFFADGFGHFETFDPDRHLDAAKIAAR